jgi:glyoxylase-like metal-dependent hydrolase (beta-lactamase superfamily II)
MALIRLSSAVWQLPLPVGHVHLVRLPSGGFAVVDTGVAGSAPAILDALDGLGCAPGDVRQILLTHSHLDHTGSAADLLAATGARVLAGALDAPYIRGDAPVPAPDLTDEERKLQEQIAAGPALPGGPPRHLPVDIELHDGDTLGDWGTPAHVLHVPGHTPGSIALHLPVEGVLFPGDVIGTGGGRAVLGPFNVDRDRAVDSFRRLAALDTDVLCVAHGDPLTRDATRILRAATPEDDWL